MLEFDTILQCRIMVAWEFVDSDQGENITEKLRPKYDTATDTATGTSVNASNWTPNQSSHHAAVKTSLLMCLAFCATKFSSSFWGTRMRSCTILSLASLCGRRRTYQPTLSSQHAAWDLETVISLMTIPSGQAVGRRRQEGWLSAKALGQRRPRWVLVQIINRASSPRREKASWGGLGLATQACGHSPRWTVCACVRVHSLQKGEMEVSLPQAPGDNSQCETEPDNLQSPSE